eukprot:349676-Chlamydomonas_euryale.AAC.7
MSLSRARWWQPTHAHDPSSTSADTTTDTDAADGTEPRCYGAAARLNASRHAVRERHGMHTPPWQPRPAARNVGGTRTCVCSFCRMPLMSTSLIRLKPCVHPKHLFCMLTHPT